VEVIEMAKVKEVRKRSLPHFTYFLVGPDCYVKCDKCCQAWYLGQPPRGKIPKFGKTMAHNLRYHWEARHGFLSKAPAA
jgi:hypothetical protein